jgi:hypothetical protein
MLAPILSAAAPTAPLDLVSASLLTCASGAELHLVARDGQRLRLVADEPTAREIATALWRALDRVR